MGMRNADFGFWLSVHPRTKHSSPFTLHSSLILLVITTAVDGQ